MKIGLRTPNVKVWGSDAAVIDWVAASASLGAVDLMKPDPELAAQARKLGVEIGSVETGGRKDILSADPAKQEKGIKAAIERIERTAAIGGKVLFEVLVPEDPSRPRRETFAIWKETYPAVVEAAERNGVMIAIEPYPGPAPFYPNLGSNPDMLRQMFSAIPSPALGLCYDPSHFARLGIDAVRVLHEFHNRIHHVHAKDCKAIADGIYNYGTVGETFGRRYIMGGGSWRYCIPGHGDLNWSEIIFHLQEYGYDGPLAIELEDAQYMATLDLQQRAVELAATYLAGLL